MKLVTESKTLTIFEDTSWDRLTTKCHEPKQI